MSIGNTVLWGGGSQAITISSNQYRKLVLAIAFWDSDIPGAITSVTYDDGGGATAMPYIGIAQRGDNDNSCELYVLDNPTSGSITLNVSHSSPAEGPSCIAFEAYGVGAQLDWDTDTTNSADVSISLTSETGGEAYLLSYSYNDATVGYGTGVSAIDTPTISNFAAIVSGYKAGASSSVTLAITGMTNPAAIAISFGAPPTIDQEGFAWGDDDNNQASHTIGTQDANYSGAVGKKILRTIVDTSGDVPSTNYELYFQQDGSGGYTAVPVGSSGKTQPVIESGDATESGNNTASSSWSVSRPTAVTGDLLLLIIGWDDSTTTTSISVANGPNGEIWTQIGSVVASASTEVRMTAYYVVATGSWGAGTITVTPSATEQWTAAVIKVLAGEFDSSTPIGASATRSSSGTAESSALSPAMTAGASDGEGTLVFAVTTDNDPLTTLQSGYTEVANTDRGSMALGVSVRDTPVSDSESIAGGDTWALASDSWCSVGFVVRAPSATNDVYIDTSSNITDGEATTARLTAPSGKSGNFTAGTAHDASNGGTVNLTDSYYSEFLHVITLASGFSGYAEFRIYADGNPLDTYTGTPRWTAVTASEAEATPLQITVTLPGTTAAYAQVATAVVAPLAAQLTAPPTSAIYAQVNTATVAPLGAALSVPSVTATYAEVATAVVSPLQIQASATPLTAVYTQAGAAAVAPLAISATAPSVTAGYIQGETAVADSLPIAATINEVTAVYTQAGAAAVAPLGISATVTSVAAGYVQVETAVVASLPIAATINELTAVYTQAAAVAPLALSATVTSVTATYIQVETAVVLPVAVQLVAAGTTAVSVTETTASVQPLQIVAVVSGVTAVFAQVETAVTQPLSIALSPGVVTPTYVQIETAAVSPLATLLGVTTVTAGGSQAGTAAVVPVALSATITAVTAVYVQVETAVAAPLALVLGTAETTAVYVQVNAAAVAPLAALLAIPAVTAVGAQVETADVNPLAVSVTPGSLTATYTQINSAVVDPVLLALMVMAATAGTASVFDFADTAVLFGLSNSVSFEAANAVTFEAANAVTFAPANSVTFEAENAAAIEQ